MNSLAAQLAEKLSNVGVKTSYGAPIEVDGATIVPVALASFGFGAGEADNDEAATHNGGGSGGGGGGFSVPVGAYITRNGSTRFAPNPIVVMAVCVPLVTATSFALARIAKAFKK